MDFIAKLTGATQRNNSLLCVGLDPDPELIPEKVSVFDFNKAIIDATADLVCAYKLNFAFYEVLEDKGLDALKRTVKYIPDGILTVGDAKRGDIANTSRAYAKSIFANYGFDAATVSPYLGFDSIEPFLNYQDRGVFILCRTSNTGADDFQSLAMDGQPLYQIVAQKVGQWNKFGNLGLVVGATYPKELKAIRQSHPDIPLLIPGIGAQGGDLARVVKYAGKRAIISSSRQIIYASRGKDFAEAARRAAIDLRDRINAIRGK